MPPPDAEIAAAAADAVAAKLRPLTNDIRTVHWQAPWQENPALAAELLAYIWLNRSPDEFAGALAKYDFPQATNALAQARETRARLMAAHGMAETDIEIVVITTTGDRIRDRPLSEIVEILPP